MEIIDPDFSKTTEGTIFKKTLGDKEDKTVDENTVIIGMMVTIGVGIGQEKDCSQEIMAIIGIEVQVIVGQDQDLELVLIETRIRCYICREYDHFTRDCPTSREERLRTITADVEFRSRGTNSFVNQ